jgi:hypothetical protein
MTTHYISFSKWTPDGSIRVQFAIRTRHRSEARTIANREIATLAGYRYRGCD